MKIGEIVKLERERKGYSLEQLSEKTEIPIYILEKLEKDENFSTNDPYGKLYAKKVLKFFNIQIPEEKKSEEITTQDYKISTKILNMLVKIIPHTLAVSVLLFFIYANANFSSKNTNIQLKQIPENYLNDSPAKNQIETQNVIDHITLISEGDVWITVNVDGEKRIINLKEGESKTIYFNNKITFETVGNAEKLKIVYNGQEVKISGREIIHNVFIDSEGIFYNGYNILRGVPKI